MKVLPYSYSSLTSFETCAHKHYRIKVLKDVKDATYAQAELGIAIHSGAETYIKEHKVPDGLYSQRIIKTVDEQRARPGVVLLAEHKVCVDRNQQSVDWFAPTAHARGIIDVFARGDTWAHLADWKTGKPQPFSTQLKHNAMLVMMHHPEIKKVTWTYEWLKHNQQTHGTLFRDFLQPEWDKFEARVIKLEKALTNNEWPKKPSGLCKQYCAVVDCEHNGNYNGKAKA